MTDEKKRANYYRLAEARTEKALKMINSFSNFTNKAHYDVDIDDFNAKIDLIIKSAKRARTLVNAPDKAKRFTLK